MDRASEEPVPMPAGQRIRLTLVEDHKVLREGLRALLEMHPDVDVVAEAGTVEDAVNLAEQLQP
ncbi:MAG: DNA-binding response regulator, partial [Gammaproteobacteria bacterium]|nr:DNA-binding response regulator [Gammaproteobacteria bacterium]